MTHPPGVWFDEAVEEFTVHARRHEQVISILQMGDAKPRWFPSEELEPTSLIVFKASKRLC